MSTSALKKDIKLKGEYSDGIVQIIEQLITMKKKYGAKVIEDLIKDMIDVGKMPHVLEYEYIPTTKGGKRRKLTRKIAKRPKKI